jgi:hypothetical protein
MTLENVTSAVLTQETAKMLRNFAETRKWRAVWDDFRNWLGWASGPRNAMKIGAAE